MGEWVLIHSICVYTLNSHSPSPSTQCTIPPGTATTVPIPDEHSSYVCPRQSRLVPDTGSKSPADCDEIPTPVDQTLPDGPK